MSRSLWWRFLALSVLTSLLLSVAYVFIVRETTGGGRAALLRSVVLLMARTLEADPLPQAMQRLAAITAESPELPVDVWVIDDQGHVLAQHSAGALPPEASDPRLRPPHVHEVLTEGGLAQPTVSVVRLATTPTAFLVSRHNGLPGRPVLRLQAIFFVGTLVAAMLLSLALITAYLRARSREARQVIAQLEAGNLQARFHPDRLDALGVLMLDFNRMAEQIERLVQRLRNAEDARRALLQELGHDLRTPLTSLRTAVDTLVAHGDAMPADERRSFLEIVGGELAYFVRLVDDLFFIADLDEPRYRHAREPVDIVGLAQSECRAVQQRHTAAIELHDELHDDQRYAPGDALLLARLLRNGLDNAARHAHAKVSVRLRREGETLRLQIADDGPGMSPEQVAAFGRRRTQRIHGDASQPTLSLGLGSVIMKTIVELHGGALHIDSDASGTRLTIELPAPP